MGIHPYAAYAFNHMPSRENWVILGLTRKTQAGESGALCPADRGLTCGGERAQLQGSLGLLRQQGPAAVQLAHLKAPHSVIDYVVIHELCHLIHPNHSKDFWRLVTRHDPQCDQHRAWLRLRGSLLLDPASV